MLDSSNLPGWLESILEEKFFNTCFIHEDAKKNEKNIFCIDCCESICTHCISAHRSHRLLQIRRYVYRDVIKLGDAEKLLDCGFVQSYTTNRAKVVFLNERPQNRTFRGADNQCLHCTRGLQYPNLFCSVSCKLKHIVSSGAELSKYINDCKNLTLSEPGLEDSQVTPESILEPVGLLRTSSGSSGVVDCRFLACSATTEFIRKKRSNTKVRTACRRSYSPVSKPVLRHRRKSTPHRAPFY